MSRIMLYLLVLFAIVFLIAVSTVVFIGSGYVLSLLLPLTLFQSVLLCIGATFVFVFSIAAGIIGAGLMKILENRDKDYDDNEDEDYEEDDEFEKDEFVNSSKRRYTYEKKRVGRNEPCPCGSGKKYKNCCGK